MKAGPAENRIAIPETLRRFQATMDGPVYMVGGAVRDALLGRPGHDLDATGAIPPETVRQRAEAAGFAVSKINRSLGTVGIVIQGETVEYTAFRTEAYAPGGGHMPETVTVGGTMQTDAVRRDFTVNALYAACDTGLVEDPLGGLADLEAHLLRQCSPVTLASDALRILRLVRFSGQLGFAVEGETFRTAKENVKGLADIAPERRREELDKILLSDQRAALLGMGDGKSLIDTLHLVGELGAWHYLIPELEEGMDMAQRADYHAYPVGEHLLRACAAMEPDLTLRLAALLHDIGKPRCYRMDGNFYRHALVGSRMVPDILDRLRYSNAIREEVTFLVAEHMYDLQGTAREATLRARFVSWGRERTRELILLREADIHGSGRDLAYRAARWRALYDAMQQDHTPFSLSELAVGGKDLLDYTGRKPGPWMRETLDAMLRHCAAYPQDNTREKLLSLYHDIAGRRERD